MRLVLLSLFAGVVWAQSPFSAETTAKDVAPGSTQYTEMALLPAGEFQMGDHHNFVDPGHPSDELPIHKVWIDALYAGVYDVTNRQYVEFLNAAYAQGLIEVRGGMVYRKESNDAYSETRQMVDYSSINWDGSVFTVADFRGTHPVTGVRWYGAAAYSNWLSAAQGFQSCYDTATWKCDFTKNGYRLPTEAEWEYAARGGTYTPYGNFPWGDDASYTKANWPEANNPYQTGAYPWTTPAGWYDGTLKRKSDFNWPGSQDSYQTGNGANGYGLYDMSGNVWQWCHDWYQNGYYSVSPYKNPTGPDKGDPMPDGQPYRVMRGGNWYNGGGVTDPGHGRVSNRDPGYFRGPQDPNHPYYHVGFRVVRPAMAPALTTVSAASYAGSSIAPGSIAATFGGGLAGATVTVKDSAGADRPAQVLANAATQINFVVPAATGAGTATITASCAGAVLATGTVTVESVAPGIFSANADGKGVAAAIAVRIKSDGSQTSEVVFQCGAVAGSCVATPLDLGAVTDQMILLIFGTGMRGFKQQATATIGGVPVPVAGPVAQSQYAGLDQLNLGPLPRSLAGRGELSIVVTVDGKAGNAVTVNLR